jgi:RNA polymerase sigma-70 factor (ECF subfamily)
MEGRRENDGALADLWRAARAAWPDLYVDTEDFASYVTEHAGQEGQGGKGLPSVERAGDLYLACACGRGQPRALAALEPLLVAAATRAAARIDRSRAFVDLVAQDVRALLLVGTPPKILDYAGRAPLESWLRTVAIRAALQHRRTKSDQPHDEIPCDLVASGAADLDLVRAKYRVEFEDAVRAALALLDASEREYLLLALRDGLTVDQISAQKGMSRATAARRVAAARDRIAAETRRLLHERLRLTPSELASIAALVGPDLHVSIVRLLGTE